MSKNHATASGRYIALLRGINVGGKNKLPKDALIATFAEAGGRDIQTYIQSGNVVFSASPEVASQVPQRAAQLIAERHGFKVPVVQRSREELARIASHDPYVSAGADPAQVLVMFLADTPSAERVKALDPNRSPGDAFQVVGREIYVHCPKGLADTKLTNDWFDRQLGTVSTGRNWRTLLKLLEMAGGPGA